jgi:hypothetical protein
MKKLPLYPAIALYSFWKKLMLIDLALYLKHWPHAKMEPPVSLLKQKKNESWETRLTDFKLGKNLNPRSKVEEQKCPSCI